MSKKSQQPEKDGQPEPNQRIIQFPYPGLRPYKRTESDIFFGRTEDVLTLLEKLEKGLHFVAVSGTSGCGKSSVIRAGLLASLNLAPTGRYWRKVVMRPGNAPFTNLVRAFLKDDKSYDQGDLALRKEYLKHYKLTVSSAQEHLENTLQNSAKSLHQILPNVLPDKHNLLIVVDQFEELFRHTQNEQEVKQFIDWLLASCEYPDAYVAITLRSEFIDRECAQYPRLHQAIMEHLFSIPCLPPDLLPEIIEGPAGIFASQVEGDLKAQLLEDVQKLEKDHRADQLPLLQYALYHLWQEASKGESDTKGITLTLQQYQNIGGLKALAQKVENAYQSVKSEHRKAVEIIFRRLSRRDEEGQYVRQVATLESLAELTGKNWASIPEVINDFRYRGFLTPSYERNLDSSGNLIDIPHESVIRQWERLRSWVDLEKEWVDFCKRLQERAQSEKDGKGELLHGLDLENALAWLNNFKELYETGEQQEAWARRYGLNFALVRDFLNKSERAEEEKHRKEEAAKEEKRIRDAQIKALKRQRWLIGGVAATVTVVVVGLASWGFYGQRLAEKAQTERTISLYDSRYLYARLAAQEEQYGVARKVLSQTYELDQSIDYVPARQARNLLANLVPLAGTSSMQSYSVEGTILNAVAISPDGQKLVAGGENGSVTLFDTQKGEIVQYFAGHQGDVMAVVFDPQGPWVATGGKDSQIIFWSLEGKRTATWPVKFPINTLAVSPDGKYLASGDDQKITVWEVATGNSIHTFEHGGKVVGLAFSHQGLLLASAGYDGTAKIWNVQDHKLLFNLQGHTDRVQDVAFSPDDQLLATSSNDRTIRLWEVNSGKPVGNPLMGHKNIVFGLHFLANGKQLVSSSADQSLRIWDVATGVTLRVLQDHTASVVDVTAQGDSIYSVSNDGTVKRWDSRLPYQQIELPSEPASVAIAPNAKRVAVGFVDGSLRLYALPKMTLLDEQLQVHGRDIQRLAFNQKGEVLVSASLDKTAKIWQIQANQLVTPPTVIQHEEGLTAVTLSPDDQYVVTTGQDGKIGIFSLATSKVQFYSAHDGKAVQSVAFNAAGQLLTASQDQVRIWQFSDFLKTEKLPQPLHTSEKQAELTWAALSDPYSKNKETVYRYVTMGRQSVAKVYQLSPASAPATLEYFLQGHESTIYRAIFSPDQQQLATASADGTLRFWDLLNGSGPFTLRLPTPRKRPDWTSNESPLYDFDFRCTEAGECWAAVPLGWRKQLMWYPLGQVMVK